MREILFRGKHACTGEWVEGFYYVKRCRYAGSKTFFCEHATITTGINEAGGGWGESISTIEYIVIPETVGQYTGLTDKNGKKIFEGDIVKAQDDVFGSPFCDGIIGKIVYDECAFFIEPINPMDSQWLYDECAVYEIIGNIHDNPELLKGGE
jgi:uncharacterized phage protein (TIGR01671 family)